MVMKLAMRWPMNVGWIQRRPGAAARSWRGPGRGPGAGRRWRAQASRRLASERRFDNRELSTRLSRSEYLGRRETGAWSGLSSWALRFLAGGMPLDVMAARVRVWAGGGGEPGRAEGGRPGRQAVQRTCVRVPANQQPAPGPLLLAGSRVGANWGKPVLRIPAANGRIHLLISTLPLGGSARGRPSPHARCMESPAAGIHQGVTHRGL